MASLTRGTASGWGGSSALRLLLALFRRVDTLIAQFRFFLFTPLKSGKTAFTSYLEP